MQIDVKGLDSAYEAENVTRLFFPEGRPLKGRRIPGEDAVLVLAGKRQLLAAVRRAGRVAWRRTPRPEQEVEYAAVRLLYELLQEFTGLTPAWGMMTGVRPVRLVHDARRAGRSRAEIEELFLRHYQCSQPKYRLAVQIADLQKPIIAASGPRDYSLYIGIPFCPSRCSYCSFVSRTTGKDGKLVQPYIDKLCLEIEELRRQADQNNLVLRSIYIGGGTPTSISADQLRQLMGCVRTQFDLSRVEEYTVEAGRPDCTDLEKLQVLREYGATRISINPQTFSDDVLVRIGRRHTAQDILRCYAEARQAGHDNINMDLIAGLPGDTVEGFEQSLAQAIALGPENITVHTLTLKRASNLVIESRPDEYDDVARMLEKCSALAEAGYQPYYLYRQKGTLQNLENTGWCKPGFEGKYNIYIMEEIHSILSAGAGGSTKLVQPEGNRIQRIFNYKYPTEYVQQFDAVLERKKGVSDFYGQYSDSETSCGGQPHQSGG